MASRNTDTDGKSGSARAAGRAFDHAGKAASATGDAAELSYEELREQIGALKADLAGLSETAQSAVKKKVRQTAHDANTLRRKAVSAARDGVEAAGDHVEDAASQVVTFARERPALAIGLSASAGFLLALALTRR